MPDKETMERAHEDAREGKSAGTQAGEFVREEIHHVREGKHGVRSPQQAIAIGLSKARRAGVKLAAPKKGKVSEETRAQAARDSKKGKSRAGVKTSKRRSKATLGALKKEGTRAASKKALSAHAKASARERGAADRHDAAMKSVRTRKATRANRKAA